MTTQPPQDPHHGRQRSPVRAPTMTYHPAPLLRLPSPDFLNPVASGAHYSGALSPPPSEHITHLDSRKRSLSMTGDDPMVEELYKDVLNDLEELFCGRPTAELFQRRWNRAAVFEDPLSKCVGYSECAAQFFALPKVFPSCKRISCRVLSATLNPNRLVLAQTQEYTLRWIGTKKTISSFVVVDLDDEFKITRLVDQWNGEDPSTSWGTLRLRRLNAKLTSWFIRVPRPTRHDRNL